MPVTAKGREKVWLHNGDYSEDDGEELLEIENYSISLNQLNAALLRLDLEPDWSDLGGSSNATWLEEVCRSGSMSWLWSL